VILAENGGMKMRTILKTLHSFGLFQIRTWTVYQNGYFDASDTCGM